MLPLTPRNPSPPVVYVDVRIQTESFNKGQLMITIIRGGGLHASIKSRSRWATFTFSISNIVSELSAKPSFTQPSICIPQVGRMNSQFRELHHQYYIHP